MTYRGQLGYWAGALLLALLTGCIDSASSEAGASSSSCMKCHNGSNEVDYAGPGVENPHPFGAAANIACTTCHGGNPAGVDKDTSHVPPPPEIGDDERLENNNHAYFNRLTLSGIDKFNDYVVDGVTYSAIDYLQFINPGDLRVVGQNRSCGVCHQPHVETVIKSPLATETGIFSGAMYAAGIENHIPAHQGLYEDTAADLGFRAVSGGVVTPGDIGAVSQLIEFPVYSVRDSNNPDDIDGNPAYDSANLPNYLEPNNQVQADSPLAKLYHEQIAFTCGDCHLGSAGANNRYGDFRSSGCTSCHMPYSLDGRSRSRDPNVNKLEPEDPDQIRAPERSHVRSHRIVSTAKPLPGGGMIQGIDDYACAGCHQGSNRTVMQYWGIRLDQNEDVDDDQQYPANPADYRTTRFDERLFDPVVNNDTFNGRRHQQYLLFEDYDDDQRDDTPADVHYEAGMGCIDCHGSVDVHGGNVAGVKTIHSRQEQAVAVQCESCHGSAQAYATTALGTAFDGRQALLALDSKGNPMRHVVLEADGHFYMYSKLTGRKHFVVQSRDTVVASSKTNPLTGDPLYSVKASFAMGRDDGDDTTGIGPQQVNNAAPTNFAHADSLNCAACHSSWTNTCMGCHLIGEYDRNNNFSNITGERIVFEEANADFVYQSPIYFQLGVNSRNKIAQTSSNTKVFFSWIDRNEQLSQVFAFSDRNGNGNSKAFGALGHNAMMAHSIRGKVNPTDEGPRYCVACHLTQGGMDQYGSLYNTFRQTMRDNRFDLLDFDVLTEHFGQNTGNQMNSPLWVHMVAGLGTGLFLFDENGCPVNPLDDEDNRAGCNNVSPADRFDLATILTDVKYNLDRVVLEDGLPQASSNHPMLVSPAPLLREPTANVNMSGPLSSDLIRRLTDPVTGILLDTWINADGVIEGLGAAALNPPAPAQVEQK